MRNGRVPTVSSRRRGATVLVFTCAASAGAHGGLVPAHLNGEPRLGAAFLIAVVLLVAAATSVAARPGDRRITSAAGLILAGLILAYVVSRTTGIPVLDPEPEAVDAVGIATSVVEALGVLVALGLTYPLGPRGRLTHTKEMPI